MATTTNYGWTTPDDTALVKDGASAIRTLGSSVDTTVKALSPGTTAGDIDYYTSSTAKSRIGIGTTGQVLTVSGGVPSWQTSSSGSITLLSTTTLSGANTTISGISQAYTDLIIWVSGTMSNGQWGFLWNGSTTLSYVFTPSIGNSNTGLLATNNNSTDARGTLQINNYSNTSYMKQGWATHSTTATGGSNYMGFSGISYASTSAITSVSIYANGGSWSSGTVLIYGVK